MRPPVRVEGELELEGPAGALDVRANGNRLLVSAKKLAALPPLAGFLTRERRAALGDWLARAGLDLYLGTGRWYPVAIRTGRRTVTGRVTGIPGLSVSPLRFVLTDDDRGAR